MIEVAIVAASAACNRVIRGERFNDPDSMSSRGALYLTGFVFLGFGLLVGTPAVALAKAFAFLAYYQAPHGRWFSLGRIPRDLSGRAASAFERLIESASDFGGERRDWLAFAIRNLIVFAPGFAAIAYATGSLGWLAVGPLAAPLFVGCYWLGWRFWPTIGIAPAEVMTGALWGLLIVI